VRAHSTFKNILGPQGVSRLLRMSGLLPQERSLLRLQGEAVVGTMWRGAGGPPRGRGAPPPPPHPRTKWTRRVSHPVLIEHAASLAPY